MPQPQPHHSPDSAVLLEKIRSREAIVAVLGLGYVGLPLASLNVRSGFSVVGVDTDPRKVDLLSRGVSPVDTVDIQDLMDMAETGRFEVTADFGVLAHADVILVCVPTPLTKQRQPDISALMAATVQITDHLRSGQLICLESTTYPGTTEELVLPHLESTGLVAGRDFFLAYSPERVDPGNTHFTTKNIAKVVGGMTDLCLQVASAFYGATLDQVVPVSSPRVAEMVKVFENTYRAVNISLVNEMMLMASKMGLDVWEVLEAAGTKPFGIQVFEPGPGIGGHCIPIDPLYLSWKAREFGHEARFIALTTQVTADVERHVLDTVTLALNRVRRAVLGSKILVIGVAYKKDIQDTRESPALRIIPALVNRGANVSYHDPFVPVLALEDAVHLASLPLSEEAVAESDLVLILTDHSRVDYDMVASAAKIVVDTRNATRHVRDRRHIVRL